MIEGLFVWPLLIVMVLSFFDLANFQVKSLLLWHRSRQWVRELSLVRPWPPNMESVVLAMAARQHQKNISCAVDIQPLGSVPASSNSRYKKNVQALTMSVTQPLRPFSPLLMVLHREKPFVALVHVAEIVVTRE